MTVSTTTNRVVYRGNGAATSFAVPFKVLEEEHLIVSRRVYATSEIEHVYVGTAYSYSGLGDSSGTLTLAGTALDDDYELVIERIVPYTQDLDIVNAGGFYPDTVEEQLDLIVMGLQQLDDLTDRALLFPVGYDAPLLPPPTADSVLGTDENNVIDWYPEENFRGPTGMAGGNVESIGLFINANGISIPVGTERVRTSGYRAAGHGSAEYYYFPGLDASYVASNPTSAFQVADGRVFILVRDQTVTPSMFGVITNATGDQSSYFNAWSTFCSIVRVAKAWADTKIEIAAPLFIGPASGDSATVHWGGHARITAIADVARLVTIRNMRVASVWNGSFDCTGNGGSVWTTRGCQVGVYHESASRFIITGGIFGFRLAYAVYTTTKNNNNTSLTSINFIRADKCGSCHRQDGGEDYGLRGTWTAKVDTGSSLNPDQRSVLDVDTLPPTWVEDYITPGAGQLFVQIGSELYYVDAIDRGAGTISIYPWLDPALAAGGSIVYIFGGAACLGAGSDHNVYNIGLIDGSFSGIVLGAGMLYPPNGAKLVSQQCGICYAFGNRPGSSCLGGETSLYCEGNLWDVVKVPGTLTAGVYHRITSGYVLDFNKIWIFAAKNGSGARGGQFVHMGGMTIANTGDRDHFVEKHPAAYTGALAPNVAISSSPHRTLVHNGNSWSPNVTASAKFHELFGYNSMEVLLRGTGAGGSPTGSLTLTPTTASWTINGGASAVFTTDGAAPTRVLLIANYSTLDITADRL